MRTSLIVAAVLFCVIAPGKATARTAVIRDCPNCPKMIALRGGEFLLGSPNTEPGRYANEGPQRQVRVDAFAIGQTEVTRAQFAEFVKSTGRDMDRHFELTA